MTENDTGQPLPADAETSEDFEILEVVGVDENGVAIAGPDPDDVEVVFDEGDSDLDPTPRGSRNYEVLDDAHLRDRMLRLQADFENFKKRMERERIDHFQYATFGLVERILPVLDNLERAILAARPGEPGDALVEGVLLIHRQLVIELEKEGLRVMRSVGEVFDPAQHEAVATDPDAPAPPHTVTEVLQKGYFLHDRVLRPAMVRVRVDGSFGEPDGDDRKES